MLSNPKMYTESEIWMNKKNFFKLNNVLKLTELDTKSEECQRFFRDGLTTSFHKILNDEAVNGWKYDIHVSHMFFGF